MGVLRSGSIVGLAVAGFLATAVPPAHAEDALGEWKRRMNEAAEQFRDGFDKALGSAELLLRALPQYEMPSINENGDIIIRRKRTDDPPVPFLRPREGVDKTAI